MTRLNHSHCLSISEFGFGNPLHNDSFHLVLSVWFQKKAPKGWGLLLSVFGEFFSEDFFIRAVVEFDAFKLAGDVVDDFVGVDDDLLFHDLLSV